MSNWAASYLIKRAGIGGSILEGAGRIGNRVAAPVLETLGQGLNAFPSRPGNALIGAGHSLRNAGRRLDSSRAILGTPTLSPAENLLGFGNKYPNYMYADANRALPGQTQSLRNSGKATLAAGAATGVGAAGIAVGASKKKKEPKEEGSEKKEPKKQESKKEASADGGGEGTWVHEDYTPKEGMTYQFKDEADKKNRISILDQTAAAVAKEHPGVHNLRKRRDEFARRIGGGA